MGPRVAERARLGYARAGEQRFHARRVAMIHVATVHWRSGRWIDLQLEHLRRHIREPFRTYAFLNGVPSEHVAKFDYASTEEIASHALKLNLLADMIGFASDDPGDLLVFIDGDAFPIADFISLARQELPKHHLIAVRRDENDGDPQPHPCFCITTVGFWKEIGGDWKRGHQWPNPRGKLVTDVGANLLRRLEERGVDWYPLLRSNRKDLHPLFFAVYGGVVYHHGGGFRGRALGGRVVRAQHKEELSRRPLARLFNLLPKTSIAANLRRRFHPVLRGQDEIRARTAEQSESVFEQIRRDPEFWRELV